MRDESDVGEDERSRQENDDVGVVADCRKEDQQPRMEKWMAFTGACACLGDL